LAAYDGTKIWRASYGGTRNLSCAGGSPSASPARITAAMTASTYTCGRRCI